MRSYVGLAAASVAFSTALGVVGWVLVPGRWTAWLAVIALPVLLWAFLESVSIDPTEAAEAIRRLHRLSVAAIGLFLVLDGAPDLAQVLGILNADGAELVRRVRGCLLGALFVAWGNHLPKIMSPWSLEAEPFDWQGVHRFAGRVFVLGGAALVVVWGFLPAPKPNGAAAAIVLGMILLGVGRKILSVLGYSVGGRPLTR